MILNRGTRIRVLKYDVLSNDDLEKIKDGIVGTELTVIRSGWMHTGELVWVEADFNNERVTVFSDEYEVIA